MTTAIAIIDAFASAPFRGNPAAVCLLEEERDAAWMQQVAAEMNLSETAFLCGHGEDGYGLRWFTPTQEVELCGHATLASAHYLWTQGLLAADRGARFHAQRLAGRGQDRGRHQAGFPGGDHRAGRPRRKG